MITATECKFIKNTTYHYEFAGKSTDTKPKEVYNNRKIHNGSSFTEMDTSKIYLYDAENAIWLAFEGEA